MSKFIPQTFNDFLALLAFIGLIPALWILQGCSVIALPDEVTGATIVVWSLIGQYYFRKAQSESR